MTRKEFARTIDHAMLWQNTPRAVLERRCREVVQYGFATICCWPADVAFAKSVIGDKAGICAVVGYPMGNHTTKVKIFEALDCLDNGATEIDVVMNISRFKDGDDDYVLDELSQVVRAAKGKKPDCIVKVIIEVYHIESREELERACEIVIASGADYVKQATGYAPDPSKNVGTENVRAIHEIVGNRIKIKNAGNPRDLDEAVMYVQELGVNRIGHNFMPEWLDAAGEDYWKDK